MTTELTPDQADVLRDWKHAGAETTHQTEPDLADAELTPEELALNAAHQQAQDVAKQVYQLRVREAAARKLRAEERAGQPRPVRITLDDFLNHDYGLPTYRITDLWPTGGRVLLAAQWKAGKTTLVGNTIRSLVDGEPFLDRYPVTPGAHVVLLDDELSEATLQSWLRDQDIKNTAAVSLISLRGRVSTFDITDPDVRAEWAQLLAGVDVIVLDCLRPILDALGLDENHEAGRFLVAFDTLLADCGASEAIVVHHMGHSGERSRGDSRLMDWPDALWKVVRDKDEEDDELDNPTGARYFSAFGRDVDVRQSELTFDQVTRHLTLGENAMNRPQATAHKRIVKADEAVMTVVASTPGITKVRLRKACAEQHSIGRGIDVDSAVERLVERGLVQRVVHGNTHNHYPGTPLTTPAQTAQTGPSNPHVSDVSQRAPDTTDMNVPRAFTGAHTDTPLADLALPATQFGHGHITPEHTDPAPLCSDCGHRLDSHDHASICEETP